MKKIEFNKIESIKALDMQIKQTFSGMECFEENVIEDKAVYSAHRSFVIKIAEEPKTVIEYQVSGTDEKGVIQLTVSATSKDEAVALADKYDSALHDQASGLEIGVESGELNCLCGANLPIDRVDVKTGLVTCEYCKQKTMVPRKYRY